MIYSNMKSCFNELLNMNGTVSIKHQNSHNVQMFKVAKGENTKGE